MAGKESVLETLITIFAANVTPLHQGVDKVKGEYKRAGDASVSEAARMRTAFDGVAAGVRKFAGVLAGLGIGTVLFKIAEDFDEANKKIRATTGETGAALKGLQNDMKAVFVSRGSSAEDASTAIITLHQRTGLAGKSLQDLAIQSMRLAKMTGSDLAGSIALTTRVMGDWGNGGNKAAGTLDYLFKLTQKTGVSLDRLSQAVVYFGAPMRQMGFDFETAAALIGKFEKEGVNVETVLTSLRRALSNLSKQGISAPEGFAQIVKEIKDAETPVLATAKAMAVFGVKGGSDMAAAIREGRFEIADLMKQLKESPETIAKASQESETLSSAFGKIRNALIAALDPLGAPMVKALDDMTPRLKGAANSVGELIKGLAGIPAPALEAMEGIAALVLLSGPIGKLEMAIRAIPLAVIAAKTSFESLVLGTMLLGEKIGLATITIGGATAALGVLALAAGYSTIKIGEAINAFLEWQRVKAENDEVVKADQEATNAMISTGMDAYIKWQKGATLGAKDLKAAILGMKEELRNIDKSSPDYALIAGAIPQMQSEYTKRFGASTRTTTPPPKVTIPGVDLSGLFDKGGKGKKEKTAKEADPFASVESANAIALAKVGAYGLGAAGELAAAKKLLNDLQFIGAKAKLDSKEQHELELKILSAKEKIRTATEAIAKAQKDGVDPVKTWEDSLSKIKDDTQDQFDISKLTGGTLEDQRSILEAQVAQLEAAQAPQRAILDARLQLLSVEEQITAEGKKQNEENKAAIEHLQKQAIDQGLNLAKDVIKGDGVSAGSVVSGAGGLIGGAIGLAGGPGGVAAGMAIGNIAGNIIGAVFDRHDRESEQSQGEALEQVKGYQAVRFAGDMETVEANRKAADDQKLAAERQKEAADIAKQVADFDAQNASTDWAGQWMDAWQTEADKKILKNTLADGGKQGELSILQGLRQGFIDSLMAQGGDMATAADDIRVLNLDLMIKNLKEGIAGVGDKIKEGLANAFSSITSLNPLPVADVSRSNFFATAPKAIFYGVQRIEQVVTIKSDSSNTADVTRAIEEAIATPGIQRSLAKANGFEGQKQGFNLGFQGA